jgi:hypothetical protein
LTFSRHGVHLLFICFAESALRHPQQLGSVSERRDVRYNTACAAALCGEVGRAEELLRQLAAAPGALKAEDLLQDEDLAAVRGLPGFSQLLQTLAEQQQQ